MLRKPCEYKGIEIIEAEVRKDLYVREDAAKEHGSWGI